MRLIDADELLILETVAYNKAQAKTDDKITRLVNEVVHKKIQMLVSDAPTAYDVDKVTHEINNKIQELDAKQQLFIENGLLNMADKMASKIGIYIECREIVEKAGEKRC